MGKKSSSSSSSSSLTKTRSTTKAVVVPAAKKPRKSAGAAAATPYVHGQDRSRKPPMVSARQFMCDGSETQQERELRVKGCIEETSNVYHGFSNKGFVVCKHDAPGGVKAGDVRACAPFIKRFGEEHGYKVQITGDHAFFTPGGQ